MVDSKEWTTGSRLFLAFDSFSTLPRAASGPLDGVDHWLTAFPGFWPVFDTFPGSQWSTLRSGPLAHGFSWLLTHFRHFLGQLVAHSTEWTTGSRLFLAFDPFSALSQAASGPLDGVDHWLTSHYILRNFGLVLAVKVALSRPGIGTV